LTWAVSEAAGATGQVFRRDAATDWSYLGDATPDGAGGLLYEDATASPGKRYQYRLALRQPSGEQALVESWVDVPGADTPAAPVLRVSAANPHGGGGGRERA